VVLDALQSYQARIDEKNQTLINNIPEDLPLIMADKTRLVQVLVNLVSNANKYSPPESTITLDAKVDAYHRDEKGNRMGPAMRISVKDTGMGMSEEDLQKLFHVRYFRTEEARSSQQPGTGLGMMITQEIVQRHGGTIWAESIQGEGTTFHFTVPLAKEELEPEAESESQALSDEVK
jgi:two-component system sensor histidine kinase VicK